MTFKSPYDQVRKCNRLRSLAGLALFAPAMLMASPHLPKNDPRLFTPNALNHAPFAAERPTQNVSGKVTDSKNAPLVGVSIIIKGTTHGTTTNAEGFFTLKDAPETGTLVFSFSGYATQEVSLKGIGSTLNISLVEQVSNLSEVVVVGYGTQSKRFVTGSVAQVKVTQLENENPGNVQDALRGNVPGLAISQVNAASAKGGGDLQVRGQSTISAGNTPLVVLDGVSTPAPSATLTLTILPPSMC